MAVFRVHKNENYTVLSNYHFKEKGMSLKAKGLLSLMLSLPENWDYSAAGLVTLSKDGKDSVNAALKELEKFGYLKRTQAIDARGKFSGYNYEIFEQPFAVEAEKPTTDKPFAENPTTEKTTTENPPQLNINKLNTKKSNTYKSNTEEEKEKIVKIDKIDKSECSPYDNFEYSPCEPINFTKELIKANYIDPDDLYIERYNQEFDGLIGLFTFEVVRSCLWYFINRYKAQQTDEAGNPIENKFAYFSRALFNSCKKIEHRNEMFSKLESKEEFEHWLYN